MGFGLQGLGFRTWGLGFSVQGLGLGVGGFGLEKVTVLHQESWCRTSRCQRSVKRRSAQSSCILACGVV